MGGGAIPRCSQPLTLSVRERPDSFSAICTCYLVLLLPTACCNRECPLAQLLLRPTKSQNHCWCITSVHIIKINYQINAGSHPRPVEGTCPSNLNHNFRGNEAAVAHFKLWPFLMKTVSLTKTSEPTSLVSRTYSHPNAKNTQEILLKKIICSA